MLSECHSSNGSSKCQNTMSRYKGTFETAFALHVDAWPVRQEKVLADSLAMHVCADIWNRLLLPNWPQSKTAHTMWQRETEKAGEPGRLETDTCQPNKSSSRACWQAQTPEILIAGRWKLLKQQEQETRAAGAVVKKASDAPAWQEIRLGLRCSCRAIHTPLTEEPLNVGHQKTLANIVTLEIQKSCLDYTF